MEIYNIETLSFLIGSFRDVTQSFGQSSKTVAFYKRQVNQLVDIGQVGQKEADLVEELVGMQNTDAVKWEKAIEKVEQFIKSINATYSVRDDLKRVILLEQFEREGHISSTVKELVYKVYGIDIKGINASKDSIRPIRFGEIPSNKKQKTEIKKNNSSEKHSMKTNKNLIEALIVPRDEEVYIRVKNSSAVCSSDPSYYKCILHNLMDNEHVLGELMQGSEFQIGKLEPYGDSCHPSYRIKEDSILMGIAKKIDWSDIVKNKDYYTREATARVNFKELLSKYGEYKLEMTNSGKNCRLADILGMSTILSELAAGKPFRIGTIQKIDDCRGPSYPSFVTDRRAETLAKKIDWKIIADEQHQV